jgi:hypothetical protein
MRHEPCREVGLGSNDDARDVGHAIVNDLLMDDLADLE